MRYSSVLVLLAATFAFISSSYAETYKVTVINNCSKKLTVRLLRNRDLQYYVGNCAKATVQPGETKTLTCKWSKSKGVVLAPNNKKWCFQTEKRKVKTSLFGKKKTANVCKVYKGTNNTVRLPAQRNCADL